MYENKENMLSTAKVMMDLTPEDKLPRKVQYMLCDAYDMVERAGGFLLSRQVIASIITTATMMESMEKRLK